MAVSISVVLHRTSCRHKRACAYDCGMSTNTNSRADSMGHGTPAVVVQLLRDEAQLRACADRGLPRRRVHAKFLKVEQIDHDGAVHTSSPW